MFGSMIMFSVLAIGAGLLLILFIFLAKELGAEKAGNPQDRNPKSKKRAW
jgi:hypothetical protein